MKPNPLSLAIVRALLVTAAAALPDAPAAEGLPSVLRVQALANGEAELLIYGFIGDSWFEESTTARSVVEDLRDITATTIHVRIDSPGGSVTDGIAIHNALRRHGARIVTYVDGQAASIASLIAQAGDERVMHANTLMMVHAPHAWAAGNAADLRRYADVLDKHASAMQSSYAAKAPDKIEEISALLTDGEDHWYSAAEAVAFGLADRVAEDEAETEDADAAAAALLGYIGAIAKAPPPIATALAEQIRAATTPVTFACLPQTTQRAVFAHIEDPEMRHKLSAVMAAASGTPEPAATPSPAAAQPAPTAATPATAGAVQPAPAPNTSPTDPIAALAERNERLRGVFASFRDVQGVAEIEAACLADPRMTVEAAQSRLISALGNGATPVRPTGGRIEAGTDESTRMIDAGVQYLLARACIIKGDEAVAARQGNPYLNASLIDMAESSLIRAGVNTRNLSREQIASRVLSQQTTSDFTVLLENTLHKMLLAGYRLTPFTWQRFCATGTLSDYRPHNRYHLSSFSDLKAVNEAGEYENGVLGDGVKETIRGARKGRILSITPEVLVNDDLGSFARITTALGQAAGRTIEKDVYALFSLNSGAGPTMSDGKALFHADHDNIDSTSAKPTAASWDAGRLILSQQMDPAANDYLDITPALWIGPTSLGTQARLVNVSEYNPDDAAKTKFAPPNTSRGMVRDVIDTPRLSGTAWYLLADPAIEPVFEVAFLDGVQTPTIEQEKSFRTDGLSWKVAHRYGVGAVGWRGAVKNAGSGG